MVPSATKGCPAGYRTQRDTTTGTALMCLRCVNGTYSDADSDECLDCDPGTYSQAGAASCKPCPAGTHSIGEAQCHACPAGTSSEEGDSDCDECPSGSYSPSAGSLCLQCPPGQWSLVGSTACSNCSAGTFNPYYGQPGCYECERGTFSNATGARLSSSCMLCPPGHACVEKATIMPVECDSNHYAPPGSSQCHSCPPLFRSYRHETICSPRLSFFVGVGLFGSLICLLVYYVWCRSPTQAHLPTHKPFQQPLRL